MKLVDKDQPSGRLIAYEIVNTATDEVATRMGVAGLTTRQLDRTYDGLIRKIDFDRYHIREIHDK